MESQKITTINPFFCSPGQEQKISSSVTVLEKGETQELQPTAKVTGIIQTIPRPLTVAISGCTSSGKTTLALLLSEIFSSFSVTKEPTDNDSPLGSEQVNLGDSQTTTPLKTAFTTTIHQDSFFIAKIHCPCVEFNSAINDESFMKESIAKIDETPIYSYSSTGTKGKANVRVTGPNTDCMEAVDFGNLLRKVQAAQSQKVEPEKNLQFKEDADQKKLIEQYSEVISSMRKKVKERLGLATINHTMGDEGIVAEHSGWVFVEGFLLFSNSMPSDNRSSKVDEKDEDLQARALVDLQQNVNEEAISMEKKLMRMKEERMPSKEALMKAFDIKLFLPTTKEVAKHRRMTRFPYVDFPAGGRHPGQMWKSEGYFEDVVWKGYEDSFGWLLKETGKENVDGVFVRTTFDDTVENTVDWAVDVILEFLGTRGKN
ncbi:hypothetical protein NHQ30_000447 [Ciborinia camelliae]|nr:hypothetical protein NHQ30_000447 [Ciborinia camelliae]